MQPLYSVDHESRQNSSRLEASTEDATEAGAPAEETPLLQRFPRRQEPRAPGTMLAVGLLLLLLICGVFIGVYLLVLQANAENILPPVDAPLQLVSRKQWRALLGSVPPALPPPALDQASTVLVVQTDTSTCVTTRTCAQLLLTLQPNSSDQYLPYNFLVSTNGQTYEARGWAQPAPLFPQYTDALVLAFIGDFTENPPSGLQVQEAKNLLAESVSRRRLSASYNVIGKNSTQHPAGLFRSLSDLPRWRPDLTD